MRDEVLIRDRAGCLWVLGSFFIAGAAVVAATLLGGAGGVSKGWAVLIIAGIALAPMSAGVWLIVSHPSIHVLLRPGGRVLRIIRNWPFYRTTRELHIDQIRHVVVRESTDSDGDAVYRLELFLSTGEQLVLQSVAQPTREPIDEALARLVNWSGGRVLVRTERGASMLPERG